MNINAIPIFGWFLSLLANVSVAVPFWFCWTSCGLGAQYFYWLPTIYQAVPFWHCVGLFIIIGILRKSLTPKIVSVSQSNSNDTGK
jgi:hypothetical protein